MARSRPQAAPAAVLPQRADPEKAREAYERIQAQITERHDEMAKLLAVSRIPPERFFGVADQALRRNPKLLTCTPSSIVRALLDAAELGLVPSGLLGSAYLVPYRNKSSNRLEAQLIPGYRGLIDLARRSGEVSTVKAAVIRERDHFEYEDRETGPYLRHRPYLNVLGERVPVLDADGIPVTDTASGAPIMKLADAGRYVGAWMLVVGKDGQPYADLMDMAQLEAVRRRSKAADDGPWVTDGPEMMKKSVTRRGLKYVPMAIDGLLNRGLELEDRAEQDAIAPTREAVAARDAFRAAIGAPVATETAEVVDEAPGPSEEPTEGPDDAALAEDEVVFDEPVDEVTPEDEA